MSEDYGIVNWNGVRFPVAPTSTYINLGRWQGKNVLGDYTRDSDEIISSKIWTSFVGGIGINRIREGSDDGRYWFGTLNDLYPFQLTLGPLSTQVLSVRYPLGDLAYTFYAADNNQVFPWDEETLTFGAALSGSLTSPPVYKGVRWNGNQYIPMGSSGYAYHSGGAVTNVAQPTQRMLPWVNRLLRISPTGSLYESFNGTTWSAALATINTSETVRNMVVYSDRNDNDTVFVTTDEALYAYDPITVSLQRTRLDFPPHPDNGLGAAVWRTGENMYITAGIGVYRFNLSTISPTGPDRDEGLPTQFRGVIRDLAPSHNLLFALVEGQQTVAVTSPTIEFDPGQVSEGDLNVSDTNAYSMLLAWNGFGWHPQWISTDVTGDPGWVCVSGADGAYRVWWGYGITADSSVYTQSMSRPFANPRQQLESGEGEFAVSGYLDTGWFDANMQEFDKLASHIELNAEVATTTENIQLFYDVDYTNTWVLLGTVTSVGHHILPFGVRTYLGQDFSYGLTFRRIRFRLEMNRANSSAADTVLAPMLDSMVLKFLRIPISSSTYNLSVMLDLEDFEGRGPDQIKYELDQLLESNEFVSMSIDFTAQEPKRVRVSQVRGTDSTGADFRGMRNVTVVELPLPSYQGRGEGL